MLACQKLDYLPKHAQHLSSETVTPIQNQWDTFKCCFAKSVGSSDCLLPVCNIQNCLVYFSAHQNPELTPEP